MHLETRLAFGVQACTGPRELTGMGGSTACVCVCQAHAACRPCLASQPEYLGFGACEGILEILVKKEDMTSQILSCGGYAFYILFLFVKFTHHAGREGATVQTALNADSLAILGDLTPCRERFQSRDGDTASDLMPAEE